MTTMNGAGDVATGATATRLEPGDLAHHQFLMKQIEYAQSAMDSWGRYLTGKYRLAPGSWIDNDGAIRTDDPNAAAAANRERGLS